MWCIQEITPEYRKRMYDVLDLYEESYNPAKPVIGIDEKPKQLIEDSRLPISMKKGKIMKQDYEYIRQGKANIFMAVEPKGGKRHTKVTDQRTKKDFAFFVRKLVDKHYARADMLRIVVDNLNTHDASSFYENFGHEEANRILQKVEFHYTPKHASWLNVAEIEIGIMDAECTDRRIKDKEMLTREVKAWTTRRNRQRKRINWTFTKQKADKKLSKHYVS
jgi:hypothetical protein